MSSEQERLQGEIEDLRGELGQTVEALVHKVDVPARAKERVDELKDEVVARGSELRDQAVDRGSELRDQAVERAAELRDQAVARGSELRDQAVARGSELRDQAVERAGELRDRAADAAERARKAARQTPKSKWLTLAAVGLALIALLAAVRKAGAR
ncbi:MAG TPA: DUF3618 domain-containing protein [Pseudonocardiaceae bacterium]|jgi:ElaB/YqjD/DUF883 family membrane-anchored ribosome-binding protein|nr:DUF3618 domain-containing protein [Pseudonocardiaceae bacterium]